MTAAPEGPTLVRRRTHARLARLKKRTALAAVLGFAALFGLVTQHAVRGASARPAQNRATHAATGGTSFFDAKSSDFAFDEGSGSAQSSATPPTVSNPPPVAQSSVS